MTRRSSSRIQRWPARRFIPRTSTSTHNPGTTRELHHDIGGNLAQTDRQSGAVAYLAGQSGFGTGAIGSAGVLSACSNTSLGSGFLIATGIALHSTSAYLSAQSMRSSGNVYLCSINRLIVSACGVAVSDGSNGSFRRSITDATIH